MPRIDVLLSFMTINITNSSYPCDLHMFVIYIINKNTSDKMINPELQPNWSNKISPSIYEYYVQEEQTKKPL